MSDIADKVLDWYAAKSMVQALRDAGGSDDLYRAHTFELKADDLFREITFTTEALAADKARLDWLEERLNTGDLDNYGAYVQSARRWEMVSGEAFTAFRDALDFAMTRHRGRTTRSGRQDGAE